MLMNRKCTAGALLAAVAALVGGDAQAVLVASYANGTDTEAAALVNLAPVVPGITVSGLSDVGFRPTPNITRETGFGPAFPSGSAWLFARVNEAAAAPSEGDNYYGFTVTADSGGTLILENLTFDFFSTSNVDGNPVTGVAEVFASVDSGAFVSFGSVSSTQDDTAGGPANTAGHGTVLEDALFDLSSITGAGSVEIRIAIGHDGFMGNPNSASSFLKDIQLTAVPEPSSFVFFAVLSAGLAARRRR